ncbi:hypothetical protein HID58_081933 [Brassica napus]|uniref:Uncharacterized protein n=1 Tax=Brassica napus TaxID=3708 RepID=A0ABQ7Y988_BRANA|nr:hypothetical protein HID58_081933 [Brassica napus]
MILQRTISILPSSWFLLS